MKPPAALVLIDGECVLCNRLAGFLIFCDRGQKLRFAALGSPAAQRELAGRNLPPPPPGTFVLIIGDRAFYRSDAAIRVCALLPFPWRIGIALAVIPRPVRDAAYAWVAALRYRLLGRVENCALLTPAQRARFLTDD